MKQKPYRIFYYIIFKIACLPLYLIPLKIGVKIGAFLGTLAFYIVPKEKEKALNNLRAAFGGEKTEEEIKKIAKALFSNLGRNVLEWINFAKIDSGWFEKNVSSEGLQHIHRALKRKKGLIILASHFGNWELMAAYLNHLGYKGIIIVRRVYIEQFNEVMVRLRTMRGNKVLYRDESPKSLLRELRKNGLIGVLPDQDTAGVEGVFVNFFGKAAYTPVAPVNLAVRTGAALLPVFLIRQKDTFRFVVEDAVKLDTSGDRERDAVINTARWMSTLENYIRKYPDQWVWMHRRWKTKPKAVTAYQMGLIDKTAQERFRISGATLMENAGRVSACEAMNILKIKEGHNQKRRIVVFCGKGNNGGDGLVLSRRLSEYGLEITTCLLCGKDDLKKDPAKNFELLIRTGARICILKDGGSLKLIEDLSEYDLIIDAIFGTGFKGAARGISGDVINMINKSGVKVLSIDIPSGLDATTGEIKGPCVKAEETITFGLPKTGFYEKNGPRSTGVVITKNIGFPEDLLKNRPASRRSM